MRVYADNAATTRVSKRALEAMLLSALISVLVELLLVFVSKLLINALVVLRFDIQGSRRKEQNNA